MALNQSEKRIFRRWRAHIGKPKPETVISDQRIVELLKKANHGISGKYPNFMKVLQMQFACFTGVKVVNPKSKFKQRTGHVVGYDLETDTHRIQLAEDTQKGIEFANIKTVDLQELI
jgi:hypothetical protein